VGRANLLQLLQSDLERIKTKPDVKAAFKVESGVNGMYKLHRELRMPFKLIPSCSGFQKEQSGYD